ncbi:MAG TPA: hypothetical protein VMV29_09695, partial [Ktedonobacterales bacterium]|nr:hypothetical protein [Ktedonobacterales bacterium]
MIAISAVIATAVWQGVSQLLLSAAQNLGVDEASRRMRDALNHRRLGRAVEQAVHQAYEQFAHEIHDRELLTAIERDRPFFQQPEVARLLADAAVATHAAEYAQTVEALAQEMHKVAPGITPSRCERAAEMLV